MSVPLALIIPRRGILPEPLPAARDDIPVVLLHGTVSSPGNFLPIALRLKNDGRRVIGIEYGHRGTDRLEICLLDIVTRLEDELGRNQRFDVVGHSLGGLMALQLAHLPQFAGRVRTIVGLGAYFKGQPVTLNRVLRGCIDLVMGPSLSQLICDGPLAAAVPAGVRVISIVSDSDGIVPRWSSELGTVVTVAGVSHARLTRLADEVSGALAGRAGRPDGAVPGPEEATAASTLRDPGPTTHSTAAEMDPAPPTDDPGHACR